MAEAFASTSGEEGARGIFESDLASRTCHFCLQTRLIDWDGTCYSTDFLHPAHVHADLGLYADVGEVLDRPARSAGPELLAAGNAYLDFVRSRPIFASAEELIDAYRRELDWEAASPSPAPRAPLAKSER